MGESRAVVLVVDDEKHTREGLARALKGAYAVATASNGAEALAWLKGHEADVVLSDLRMPGVGGMDLLGELLRRPHPPAVVLLTAYGSIETAVEAMKRGAYDFLSKPVNLDRLDVVVERAVAQRRMGAENRRLRAELDRKYGMEGIVGNSAALKDVLETVRQVAPVDATVLIQGESGTGKELVARALHQLSPRAGGPFVAVHCAALSPTLLESELFGHERGAFTGATERRKGRFELADGGTLFLDEIGEITTDVQVKLLRALEERAFERVGGTELVHTDVRLVAATNRDLKAEVEAGRFRQDLYYRLYVVSVTMPPLREREGDVIPLAKHFLDFFSREHRLGPKRLTAEAADVLCAYRWPGNVRELRNTMERMAVLSKGEELGLGDVPAPLRAAVAGATAPSAGGGGAPGGREEGRGAGKMEDARRAAEKATVAAALAKCGGNRAAAARELGVSRRTLYRKMEEYGLAAALPAGKPGA